MRPPSRHTPPSRGPTRRPGARFTPFGPLSSCAPSTRAPARAGRPERPLRAAVGVAAGVRGLGEERERVSPSRASYGVVPVGGKCHFGARATSARSLRLHARAAARQRAGVPRGSAPAARGVGCAPLRGRALLRPAAARPRAPAPRGRPRRRRAARPARRVPDAAQRLPRRRRAPPLLRRMARPLLRQRQQTQRLRSANSTQRHAAAQPAAVATRRALPRPVLASFATPTSRG